MTLNIKRKRSLELNIPLLYTAGIFGGLIFWTGIEKLFLLSIGGDGFAVSFNAVVLIIVILFLDIPTGALADRWGRKNLLLAGLGSLFLSSLFYSLAQSPKLYLVGTIFFGIAFASINGSTHALTYDSLQEMGRAKEYNKVNGRLQAALAIGAGFALLSSGFLAQHFGFRFNFRLAMLSSAIAFAIGCLLTEPKEYTFEKDKPTLKVAVKESFKTIRLSKFLIAAAVLFMVTMAFRWMSESYSQLVFIDVGVPLSMVGVLGFLAVAGGAVGRIVSHHFTSYTKWLVLVVIVLFATVGFIPNSAVILVCLTAFYGFNQLVQNICESEIQDHLPSHIRATATSVFTALSTFLIVPFGLITGFLIDKFSVFAAFKFGAILGAIALTWWALQDKAKLEVKDREDLPPNLPV